MQKINNSICCLDDNCRKILTFSDNLVEHQSHVQVNSQDILKSYLKDFSKFNCVLGQENANNGGQTEWEIFHQLVTKQTIQTSLEIEITKLRFNDLERKIEAQMNGLKQRLCSRIDALIAQMKGVTREFELQFNEKVKNMKVSKDELEKFRRLKEYISKHGIMDVQTPDGLLEILISLSQKEETMSKSLSKLNNPMTYLNDVNQRSEKWKSFNEIVHSDINKQERSSQELVNDLQKLIEQVFERIVITSLSPNNSQLQNIPPIQNIPLRDVNPFNNTQYQGQQNNNFHYQLNQQQVLFSQGLVINNNVFQQQDLGIFAQTNLQPRGDLQQTQQQFTIGDQPQSQLYWSTINLKETKYLGQQYFCQVRQPQNLITIKNEVNYYYDSNYSQQPQLLVCSGRLTQIFDGDYFFQRHILSFPQRIIQQIPRNNGLYQQIPTTQVYVQQMATYKSFIAIENKQNILVYLLGKCLVLVRKLNTPANNMVLTLKFIDVHNQLYFLKVDPHQLQLFVAYSQTIVLYSIAKQQQLMSLALTSVTAINYFTRQVDDQALVFFILGNQRGELSIINNLNNRLEKHSSLQAHNQNHNQNYNGQIDLLEQLLSKKSERIIFSLCNTTLEVSICLFSQTCILTKVKTLNLMPNPSHNNIEKTKIFISGQKLLLVSHSTLNCVFRKFSIDYSNQQSVDVVLEQEAKIINQFGCYDFLNDVLYYVADKLAYRKRLWMG